MKKLSIALFLLFAFSLSASAQDYIKKKIWEMAGTADLVITAKVKEAKGTNIVLEDVEAVMGEFSGSTMEYKGSKGYKTFKRHSKYLPGEELLIFLKNDEGTWTALGEAGEGEKLIMGDKIYLDSRGEGIFNKFTYHKLAVADEKMREKKLDKIYAEEMLLQEFLDAVKPYPDCFSVGHEPRTDKQGNVYEAAYAEQKCDEKALDNYRFINLAADKLAEESLAAVK